MPTPFRRAEQLQRLVERRQLGRDLAQRGKALPADPAAGRTVADLQQVVRMGQHERPVVQLEDVELDQVAAELDRAGERAQRVLRLEGGSALVADAQRPGASPQLHLLNVPNRGSI